MAQPTRTPANASPASSRTPTHDSGPPWIATPSDVENSHPLSPCRFIPALQTSLDPAALELADHDPQTGLWNRRRFEKELDRSRQNEERLALLSIDVDAYRDVIHRHGAVAAETLIRSISHVLAKRLQPNKTLARMGGDEFAATLPGATPQYVRNLANGLCTAVRDHSHTTGSNRIHATISIGGAFLNAGTQTHHDALVAADTALYEAKAAGGDRAILHQSPHAT